MVDFIHHNKELYGVEAICRILPIAPSTYYRTLDLCDEKHCFAREHRAKRDLHDEHHAEQIKRIWKESSGCQRQFKTDPFYLKNSKVKLTPLMIY